MFVELNNQDLSNFLSFIILSNLVILWMASSNSLTDRKIITLNDERRLESGVIVPELCA